MKNTTIPFSQGISKKAARKLVFEKLSGALSEYKEGLKEKKFVNNLKKASKLFAADIAKTIGKKKVKAQKLPKKKMKITEEQKANKEDS